MKIFKLIKLTDSNKGYFYGSDGYIYLPHPTDPRPSRCRKGLKIPPRLEQKGIKDYL